MHSPFDILEDGAVPLPDHQYIWCHMIFDVKMEDFYHKVRLIAGGTCNMKAPATLTSLLPKKLVVAIVARAELSL